MPSSGKDASGAARAAWSSRQHVLAAGAILLAGSAVAAGIITFICWPEEVPEPPSVELANAVPPVVKAIEEARARVSKSPRSAGAWGWLGVVFAANRYFPDARVCFEIAERLDPHDPRWPYLQVQRSESNDPEAIPKLERAVHLAHDPPDGVRLQLAELLMAQGRLDEAEHHFQAALEREHEQPTGSTRHGQAGVRTGSIPKKQALIRQAAASPFTRKASCRLLVQVLQASGDSAAASRKVQELDKLPEDRPFPPPYFARETKHLLEEKTALSHAEELTNQGRLSEATPILRQLSTKYPDWGPAWLYLGQVMIRVGDLAAAEQALRNAVRLYPGSAKPHFFLGVALTEQGRNEEAAASFRQATQMHPNYAEAHYCLGRCLQALGDWKGAIESLQAAVRFIPSYVQARVLLGELLAQNGRTAEGLEQVRCAAHLQPEDDKIKKLIQKLEGEIPPAPRPEDTRPWFCEGHDSLENHPAFPHP